MYAVIPSGSFHGGQMSQIAVPPLRCQQICEPSMSFGVKHWRGAAILQGRHRATQEICRATQFDPFALLGTVAR